MSLTDEIKDLEKLPVVVTLEDARFYIRSPSLGITLGELPCTQSSHQSLELLSRALRDISYSLDEPFEGLDISFQGFREHDEREVLARYTAWTQGLTAQVE